VLGNWLWGFAAPYIQLADATKGPKIGYLFMGFAGMALIFAIFFAPELKGRSLEEVDEMFQKFRWGWEYKGYKTTGVGAAVAQAEHGELANTKEVADGAEVDEKNVTGTQVQVNLV
jgi:SP family sugar:H+ symporter-like MFS transporter